MVKKREEFKYQGYFCEENIWHLVNSLSESPVAGDYQVLFFINPAKTVLLMNQRAFGDAGIGCWDYHVVLFDRGNQQIVDFDTNQSFESDAADYLISTFPHQELVEKEHRTTVRIISAEDYLNFFSSDRSHMLDHDGIPISQFPPWVAVVRDNQPLRLTDLMDSRFLDSRVHDMPVESFAQTLKVT